MQQDLAFIHLIQLIAIASGSGILIRLTFGVVGQKWATTYHNTMTYLLLPVIGMAITKSISGNIALSLGMIGALSIVRFRHPVKSPLELVVFFLLLTVGVVVTVQIALAVALTLYAISIIFLIEIYKKINLRMGRQAFGISFAEGDSKNYLSVKTNKKIEFLETRPNLIQVISDNQNNIYEYKFASSDRKQIEKLSQEINEIESHILNSELIIS